MEAFKQNFITTSVNQFGLLLAPFITRGRQESRDSVDRSSITLWNSWDSILIHNSEVTYSLFGICCVFVSSCCFVPRALHSFCPAPLNHYACGLFLWLLAPAWLLDTSSWIFLTYLVQRTWVDGRPNPLLNLKPRSYSLPLGQKDVSIKLTWMFIKHYYLFALCCWWFLFS